MCEAGVLDPVAVLRYGRSMESLRVLGAVRAEVSFDRSDLETLPGQVPDIGARVPGRTGQGVVLSSLLERAGPRADATHVTLTSSDGGFAASVPLDAVADAIVAYADQGESIPASRGGPYRFFLPTDAGCATAEVDACANVKFLATIRLTVGAGEDTRPKNPTEHAALHEHD